MRAGIERRDRDAEHQLNALLVIESAGAERLHRQHLGGGQHGLGKRRPLIGRVRLVADQQDTAVEALAPHRHGCPAASLSRADDDMDVAHNVILRSDIDQHVVVFDEDREGLPDIRALR